MAQLPLPACCCCCCWATAAGFGAATAFWPEGKSVISTSLAVRNLIKTEIFGDKPSYHLAAFFGGPFWEDFRIQKHSNQHNLETLGGQHVWSTTPSSCPKLASCSFSCCGCLSQSSRSLLKSSWLQVKVVRIFQGAQESWTYWMGSSTVSKWYKHGTYNDIVWCPFWILLRDGVTLVEIGWTVWNFNILKYSVAVYELCI